MRLVTFIVLASCLTNAMVCAKSVTKAVDAEIQRRRESGKKLKSNNPNPAPEPADNVVEKYYHSLGALAEHCKGTVNPDKCIVCECPVAGVIICHRKRNCASDEKLTSARHSLSLVKVAAKEPQQLLSNPYLPQYEPEYYDEK